MSGSKHTPGPWVAILRDKTSNPPFIMCEGDSSGWIGQTCTWMGLDEAESNARLIAAAPELLAAATLALSIAESWIHDQLDGTSSLDGELANLTPVRAAIAKATGSPAPPSEGRG